MAIGSMIIGLFAGLVAAAIAYWALDLGGLASVIVLILIANVVAFLMAFWSGRRK